MQKGRPRGRPFLRKAKGLGAQPAVDLEQGFVCTVGIGYASGIAPATKKIVALTWVPNR